MSFCRYLSTPSHFEEGGKSSDFPGHYFLGGLLTREKEGCSPLPAEFRYLVTTNRLTFPLRYSKGKNCQEGWVKETDKITFTNFIHNFDLKYLCVKSSFVKIRQEHKVVPVNFEICVAHNP